MTISGWRLDWPAAGGKPVAEAILKARPEHFQVEEILDLAGFPAGSASARPEREVPGQGEHLCVRLEKTGDNTEYVARELSRLSGCQPHDVGLCGLKDRHAVTRQWFSVYRPGMMDSDADYLAAVRSRWPVLAVCRFARKLRRGEHRANRFDILLTRVEADAGQLDQALNRLTEQGCPNYFGSQRFGWNGNNLDQACRLKPGRQRGRNNRNGLYFSAARSWFFNEVLAQRVLEGSWNQPLPGEPSENGITGPLWGDGGTTALDQQEALEREIVARHPKLEGVFSQTRMKPERRSLILRPGDFRWHREAPDSLRLIFELEPGQFATTLLAEVFSLTDASQTPADKSETNETGHDQSLKTETGCQ
ncbi:tRNA pseudouridine(13) synthase TruD [Marinobacter sp.]|uniref:tRNA pseudouridine(13) synthase TruD n=1 Tax=Marinobacter sp. TaxID=50741 RepID=UPI00384C7ACC